MRRSRRAIETGTALSAMRSTRRYVVMASVICPLGALVAGHREQQPRIALDERRRQRREPASGLVGDLGAA